MRRSELKAGDPYFGQWMQYRRVRRRSHGLSLLLVLGGGLLSWQLLAALAPAAPGWAWLVALVPWLFAGARANQAALRCPCPRCGKPFHAADWYRNDLARRCIHCELPKWAPGEGQPSPEPGA